MDLVAVFLLGGVLATALDLAVRYSLGVRVAEQQWGALANSALNPWLAGSERPSDRDDRLPGLPHDTELRTETTPGSP
ncbi:hypothetical protein [Streptosporangium sp. 'caverna']|uniref:hypothetical protein n=1 Tax=Streptosporangium sp. 'caverna' TaxID=2202249 RepID=UPI0013A6DC6B|nr:hypothetical protein [Streptosporangium sp. 'caverna']